MVRALVVVSSRRGHSLRAFLTPSLAVASFEKVLRFTFVVRLGAGMSFVILGYPALKLGLPWRPFSWGTFPWMATSPLRRRLLTNHFKLIFKRLLALHT